ncbi:MAG: SphA family protein [Armatimonadota bacterium]
MHSTPLRVHFRHFMTAAQLLVILFAAGIAGASEGGITTYNTGFQDTLSGVLPAPGGYFKELYYNYSGGAVSNIVRERQLRGNPDVDISVNYMLISQVTKTKIWGSYYAWAIIAPLVSTTLNNRMLGFAGTPWLSKGATGFTDIPVIPFMLGWHNGNSHQKAFLIVYIPTGDFSAERVLNTTLNRWAIDLDYAYTYKDDKTRREVSVAPGLTVNFENPDTDYHSGNEFHVDYAALQRFPNSLGFGLVGYFSLQTSPDTGPGAVLGGFKGHTQGIGPIVVYDAKIGSKTISLTGKYYSEFDVTNRFSGHSFWINALVDF